jgi:hypothetical protein
VGPGQLLLHVSYQRHPRRIQQALRRVWKPGVWACAWAQTCA